MSTRSLRIIGTALPLLFLAVLEALRAALVGGRESLLVALVLLPIEAVGIVLFAWWVVGLVARRERQLRALTEAGRVIGGDLALSEALQHAVGLGRALVGARYGALAVFGDDQRVRDFLTSGISAEERARIGALPQGAGLLGAVVREGVPIRLADVRTDPRFTGFPPHHPPMRSLLAVPVVGRGTVLGNLYVTEKVNGRPFDRADEEILTAFAAHAALAIDNARLYTEARLAATHLERLIESSGDAIITTGADGIILSWNRGAEEIYGFSKDEAVGRRLPMVPDDGLEEGREILQRVLAGESMINLEVVRRRKNGGRIPVAVTVSPMRDAADRIVGVLGVSKDLSTYRLAEQQRHRLALLEERECIGRDLHDGVIQALYALALTLGAQARRTGESAETASVLSLAVDGINGAIQDLRRYLFGAEEREPSGGSNAFEDLQRLGGQVRAHGLLDVDLRLDEAVVRGLSAHQGEELVQIAREAVANVVRHASAAHVCITLGREGRLVALTVQDDGRGFDTARPLPGHGVQNMKARASALDGTLRIESPPGGGTRVRLELPLPGT